MLIALVEEINLKLAYKEISSIKGVIMAKHIRNSRRPIKIILIKVLIEIRKGLNCMEFKQYQQIDQALSVPIMQLIKDR